MNTVTTNKKPLDPHLFSGPDGTVDDVRVQSGYPVWNLIEAWKSAGYADSAIADAYSDIPADEWQAAKQYYLDHMPFY